MEFIGVAPLDNGTNCSESFEVKFSLSCIKVCVFVYYIWAQLHICLQLLSVLISCIDTEKTHTHLILLQHFCRLLSCVVWKILKWLNWSLHKVCCLVARAIYSSFQCTIMSVTCHMPSVLWHCGWESGEQPACKNLSDPVMRCWCSYLFWSKE